MMEFLLLLTLVLVLYFAYWNKAKQKADSYREQFEDLKRRFNTNIISAQQKTKRNIAGLIFRKYKV